MRKSYIFFLLLLILILPPCSAKEIKNNKYISFSLESFFNIRGDKIDNQIYSPFGVNSCVSALTYMLHGKAKTELTTEIKNSGINDQQLFYSNDDEANLQFFTTMLTRYSITQAEKDKIKQAKIILGEKILAEDTNQQQQDERNELKQKIQEMLQQKFKGKQSLDYKELWSSDDNVLKILKIISALKFEAKWLDGKFEKIGKHKFTSFDNQELIVDYMKNKIKGFASYNDANGWKSVRIFYENNYILDIIIPKEEAKYSNTDKSEIIANLIEKSNTEFFRYDIILQMPLFKFKQKSNITDMLKDMFPSFKNKNVELNQECVIKVDEEGTIADATTNIGVLTWCRPPIEIIVDSSFYYMLSEIEQIENIEHKLIGGINCSSYDQIKNIIMVGAVNNPLLEN
jgi:hypothetical protein